MVELTILDGIAVVSTSISLIAIFFIYAKSPKKSLLGNFFKRKTKKAKISSSPGIVIEKIQSFGLGKASSKETENSNNYGSWERSRKKKELGYYYSHQGSLPNDGIESSEYEMNKPKKLGKISATTKIPSTITNYSYQDFDGEVRIDFKQEKWDWSLVRCEEIKADWAERTARLTIDSAQYGLFVASFTDLYGKITGVAVRKLKAKLQLVLFKEFELAWSGLKMYVPEGADPDPCNDNLD
mmetsp:Transcript_6123/g.9182  ORF Transcript_6123/g.9182 Transcript_6123/m.9182 type:complete len:240 (+) Transcript_6123:90-809(+)